MCDQCPIGQLLGLWNKPLAGVTIEFSCFHLAKCFVLGFGWTGRSLCAQVAKTFAVNNVVLLSPQSEKHRKITILKSLGKKPTMTIADYKTKSR